jgi:glucose/arabinose dehydrogenase
MKTKRINRIAAAWLPTLAIAGLSAIIAQRGVQASPGGRVGFSGNPATTGGQTCTLCHASGAAIPTVTISGPAAVTAGSTNAYRLTITGGRAVVGGFNVSTEAALGVLSPGGSDTQLIAGELTHTAPKPFSAGSVSFDFFWTAPASNDTVTFYGAGNSTNGNGELTGDGVAATVFDVTVSGSSGTPAPTATPPANPMGGKLVWRTAATGLDRPIDIQNAGDERLFVAEQTGRIRIVQPDGAVRGTPFLDLSGQIQPPDSNGENGLLGLTFAPDYAQSKHFFVYYSVQSQGELRARVSRFTTSAADLSVADHGSEVLILEVSQPNGFHLGGQLAFGSDGMLYIAVGDGGPQGDPGNYAQDPNSLRGKMLRIAVTNTTGPMPQCDVSGQQNYRIPPDNPYVDADGCDEIWQLGLRNPWRFSFDSATQDIWIGDVGWNKWEEVDWRPSASSKGVNWGWRCREGQHPHDMSLCDPQGAYVDPVIEYGHQGGRCSIIGGRVYRGAAWPQIQGHYFYADFCTGEFWSLRNPGVALKQTAWGVEGNPGTPVSFGVDHIGELYVAFHAAGQIARLENPSLFELTQRLWLPLVFRSGE